MESGILVFDHLIIGGFFSSTMCLWIKHSICRFIQRNSNKLLQNFDSIGDGEKGVVFYYSQIRQNIIIKYSQIIMNNDDRLLWTLARLYGHVTIWLYWSEEEENSVALMKKPLWIRSPPSNEWRPPQSLIIHLKGSGHWTIKSNTNKLLEIRSKISI